MTNFNAEREGTAIQRSSVSLETRDGMYYCQLTAENGQRHVSRDDAINANGSRDDCEIVLRSSIAPAHQSQSTRVYYIGADKQLLNFSKRCFDMNCWEALFDPEVTRWCLNVVLTQLLISVVPTSIIPFVHPPLRTSETSPSFHCCAEC